jgi:hypothetical protein
MVAMVTRAQIGSLVARHPGWAVALLFAGLAGAVFIVAYFEPQKLFVDDPVNEAAPGAASSGTRSAETSLESPAAGQVVSEPVERPAAPPQPTALASGTFRSLEHTTVGTASVVELPEGGRVLRLEGFETSNGPDLRVYLSAGSSDAFFGKEYGRDYVELGELKGNIGSQNYPIPSEVDLAKYRNAVIWCKRFSVGFGVATLK